VAFPYTEVFLGLLVAYMVYSFWARLDARYPIGAALVLLVITAVVDAVGNSATANTLAEYVFFLLGAGVVLLLLDHFRERRPAAAGTDTGLVPAREPVPAEAAQERKGASEDALHGLEQQPVPVVDAVGDQNQYDEEAGDAEPKGGKGEKRDPWVEDREEDPDR
jgi:hypothetical protein